MGTNTDSPHYQKRIQLVIIRLATGRPEVETKSEFDAPAKFLKHGWAMAQVEDFYRSSVPVEERRRFLSVLFPLLGYVFIFAIVFAGGVLGSGLYLRDALIAGVVAALLLGILAGLDGIVAADTGLSFGLLVRHSFGQIGSWLPNVLIPVILIVWFGISVSFVADVFVNAYGGNYFVYAIAMGGFFFASAYYGIRMLVMLSYPMVAFCLAVGAVLIGGPIWQQGGLGSLFELPPVKPISVADGITIAIGSFVTGATTASLNILRYARTAGQGGAAGFISMGVGFFFILLMGIVGVKASGSANVIDIGKSVGMYQFGLWMLILLTWTTLDKTLYSASLTFSASSGIPRSRVTIILGIVGITLGLMHSIDFIVPWLKTLGIVIPPLMGIIQADYWMNRFKGRRWGVDGDVPFVDYIGVCSWAVAVASAWWATQTDVALSPALISIVVAVGVHTTAKSLLVNRQSLKS